MQILQHNLMGNKPWDVAIFRCMQDIIILLYKINNYSRNSITPDQIVTKPLTVCSRSSTSQIPFCSSYFSNSSKAAFWKFYRSASITCTDNSSYQITNRRSRAHLSCTSPKACCTWVLWWSVGWWSATVTYSAIKWSISSCSKRLIKYYRNTVFVLVECKL